MDSDDQPNKEPVDWAKRQARLDRQSWWAMHALALGMLGFGVSDLFLRQWVNAFGHTAIAAVWFSFVPIRNMWIANGYRRGRSDALETAMEAHRRGLSTGQWIESEFERLIGASFLRNPEGDL